MARGRRLADIIGMGDDQLIMKACSCAMKAHKSPEKPYVIDKTRGSSETVLFISFPGSWSSSDWFAQTQTPFGETKINRRGNPPMFPSLRSIGNEEVATVNEAFLRRFEDKILGSSDFQEKVQKAVRDKRKIVFTGHSLGGSIAILATLWFLENCLKSDNRISPLCVTFGCPLIGNHIFSHALRREKWAPYFIHFVMRYDIVPRLLLAPIPSIEQEFDSILQFFATQSSISAVPEEALIFYTTVMRNAASVASHAACNLMANTNLLLETVTSFTALSPYKPFGTYIFCTGSGKDSKDNGKLAVLRNPDAALQLLFYSSQLNSEKELQEIACKSLHQHFGYEKELQSLEMQDVVDLKQLETLSYSAEATGGDSATINSALDDLGLSTRARLCVLAALGYEKRKQKNKDNIDAKTTNIQNIIKELESYRANCEPHYYDAFRLHQNGQDFYANVKRLELVGTWDEIVEMLKRYQLPDDFEAQEGWVELGTRYRRLVEPIDVANYYRHCRNDGAGPYLGSPGKHRKPRPKRYIYTQRWHEHAQKLPAEASGESHFWAEVEELRTETSSIEGFEQVKPRVLQLERNIQKWVTDKELDKDVLREQAILVKWWKTLPDQHKKDSCILGLINP